MTPEIATVAVLGTGVLGAQIAYQTAYRGFAVTAYDINDEALAEAENRFRALAARYQHEVPGADGQAEEALKRISSSADLADAVRDADLVIESVPEVLELKRGVYTELGQLAPERTIFATNSSTLLPSDLAGATGRPERFLALHFANEIWVHNVAEIMGHPGTDPDVQDAVVRFARGIGMEPIELRKEQPGYVLNSLTVPFLFAALDLVVRGVADAEMVDKTWRISTDAPRGPFQMMDVIGLRTMYNIAAASGQEHIQLQARYLKERYIDQGKLGRETGEGFYTYPVAG